jgi:hypothetical protein
MGKNCKGSVENAAFFVFVRRRVRRIANAILLGTSLAAEGVPDRGTRAE